MYCNGNLVSYPACVSRHFIHWEVANKMAVDEQSRV